MSEAPHPELIDPAAVLWDLDGTLVDTEPAWIAAETELARRYEVEWTDEDSESMIGSALPNAAAIMRRRGVELDDDAIIGFLIARVLETVGADVPWQPGAVELLTGLRDAAIPCALVTMSYREMAERIVAGAPHGAFGAIVAGDQVANGKPHPEPYLTAADALGVDIRRCVAIEDSPTGLASAEAAGARVIGVQSQLPVAHRAGRSRVRTLDDLTVDDLRRVGAGTVIDRMG